MAVLGLTNLTGCNSIPDFIAGGSLVTFQQTSAPTSWTKQTTHNNKALRVVSGTASSGGSTAFTSVFTSRTPTGSVSVSNAAVTLSTAQLASHNHSISGNTNLVTTFPGGQTSSHGAATGGNTNGTQIAFSGTTNNTGSNNSHTHSNTASFSGSALDFAVQYVDIIICSKN
jgi:hypothetical protein